MGIASCLDFMSTAIFEVDDHLLSTERDQTLSNRALFLCYHQRQSITMLALQCLTGLPGPRINSRLLVVADDLFVFNIPRSVFSILHRHQRRKKTMERKT